MKFFHEGYSQRVHIVHYGQRDSNAGRPGLETLCYRSFLPEDISWEKSGSLREFYIHDNTCAVCSAVYYKLIKRGKRLTYRSIGEIERCLGI